jgi:hypothetical protein
MEFGARRRRAPRRRASLPDRPEVTVGVRLEDTEAPQHPRGDPPRRQVPITRADVEARPRGRSRRDSRVRHAGRPLHRIEAHVHPGSVPPPRPRPTPTRTGSTDDKDQCPQVAQGDKPDPEEARLSGAADKDKDGIADDADACIDVPGVASPDATKNGCPATPTATASSTRRTSAPTSRKATRAIRSNPGCPAPPDADGDGVFDRDDACPAVKGLPNAGQARRTAAPATATATPSATISTRAPRSAARRTQDPEEERLPEDRPLRRQRDRHPPAGAVRDRHREAHRQQRRDPRRGGERPQGAHRDHQARSAGPHRQQGQQGREQDALAEPRRVRREGLVAKGVAAERLTAKGYGQEVPSQTTRRTRAARRTAACSSRSSKGRSRQKATGGGASRLPTVFGPSRRNLMLSYRRTLASALALAPLLDLDNGVRPGRHHQRRQERGDRRQGAGGRASAERGLRLAPRGSATLLVHRHAEGRRPARRHHDQPGRQDRRSRRRHPGQARVAELSSSTLA